MSVDKATSLAAFEAMCKEYEEKPKDNKVSFLIIGDSGIGKTTLLETLPRPILIDSFDPGGTKGLKDSKDIIIRRWENESALNPSSYTEWEKQITKDIENNVFEHVASYALDSATTFFNAMLNQIVVIEGRKPIDKEGVFIPAPAIQDYGVLLRTAVHIIKFLQQVPCHFVLTAHVSLREDEVTKAMYASPSLIGQTVVQVPLLFDEIYYMLNKRTSAGELRYLLTSTEGKYKARTRIGRGKFEVNEQPNLTNLLIKAGKITKE
jgi:hypothetical protein